jgi:hypothetical protein
MIEVIQDRKVKAARKEYHCDASDFLRDMLGEIRSELSFSEKRLVVKARQENWKIKKGSTYLYQYNKIDNDTYSFRCRPEIHQLCVKYDLYPDV